MRNRRDLIRGEFTLRSNEIPTGNDTRPTEQVVGKARAWILHRKKALSQNTVAPLRKGVAIAKRGADSLYAGYEQAYDTQYLVGSKQTEALLESLKKRGEESGKLNEKHLTNTEDIRKRHMERIHAIRGQAKEREQEKKQEQRQKQKERRTEKLGRVIGLLEPVGRNARTMTKTMIEDAEQGYRGASLQKERSKYSLVNIARKKTIIPWRKDLQENAKEKGKNVWSKGRALFGKTKTGQAKQTIVESESYGKGKEKAQQSIQKTKKLLGGAGRHILGEEEFDTLKKRTVARKKRLIQQKNYALKHPYKTLGYKAPVKLTKGIVGVLGKTNKVNVLASKKMTTAAKMIVERDGLFAVFKPLYWSLLINSKIMMYPQPIFTTGLLFGIIMMVWFFGSMSGYYGLYAAKAVVATFANVFLTVGNAFIFAINGIYTLITMGIVTILNQVFYYFIGGIIQVINQIISYIPLMPKITLDFVPIGAQTYSFDPPVALAYLVPTPIEGTSIGAGIMSTLFGYSFIVPGAQFYEYNMATDSYELELAFVGENLEKLYLPKINEYAQCDSILVDMGLADRPPPIQYNFTTNLAGYVERYNPVTGQMERTLIKQTAISKTVYEDVMRSLFGNKQSIDDWLSGGTVYYEKDRVVNWKALLEPGKIENVRKNVPPHTSNNRHYFFLIAALQEWEPALIDKVSGIQANAPESWYRAGSLTGTDGKRHDFKTYANAAKTQVAEALEEGGYTLEYLEMMTKEDGPYEFLCMHVIYPEYITYIEEHIAPWYPLS